MTYDDQPWSTIEANFTRPLNPRHGTVGRGGRIAACCCSNVQGYVNRPAARSTNTTAQAQYGTWWSQVPFGYQRNQIAVEVIFEPLDPCSRFDKPHFAQTHHARTLYLRASLRVVAPEHCGGNSLHELGLKTGFLEYSLENKRHCLPCFAHCYKRWPEVLLKFLVRSCMASISQIYVSALTRHFRKEIANISCKCRLRQILFAIPGLMVKDCRPSSDCWEAIHGLQQFTKIRVCVCVYIYICLFIYLFIYSCIDLSIKEMLEYVMYTYIYICTCSLIYIYMFIYIHLCVALHSYTDVCCRTVAFQHHVNRMFDAIFEMERHLPLFKFR